MTRLYGSSDQFPDGLLDTYHAFQSVNFVTAHDGFCLYDLVSYNRKHNLANGWDNADGSDHNVSWNCGHEGDDGAPPEVLALRRQQVKNFCALLLLSNGTPMFCAGDEFMHTQGGNNNPYNQDNETTWLDWSLLDRNRDIHRFFKMMIAFRKAHPSIGRSRFWRDDVQWYGMGREVDWSDGSHHLAYCLRGASQIGPRSLRDDQCGAGGPDVHGPGGRDGRLAPGGGHGAAVAGGHPGRRRGGAAGVVELPGAGALGRRPPAPRWHAAGARAGVPA